MTSMPDYKISLFEEKGKFTNFICKVSMAFKDPLYERKYQTYKYGKKNLLIVIGIGLLFNLFIMSFRVFKMFLKLQFDLIQIGSTDQLISIIILVCVILLLVLEGLAYFASKIKFLRGFFSSFFLTFVTMLQSNLFSITKCNSELPLFAPLSGCVIITITLMAFLYSSNWICGSIQVFIMIVGIDIYIIYFPAFNFEDKPLLLIASISTFITLILSIYYFEYFQRKSIFRRIESEKQRKVIKTILEKLPEPLLISQKGSVQYSNNSFLQIMSNHEIPENNDEERKDTVRELNEQEFLEPEKKLGILLNSLVIKEKELSFFEIIKNEQIINQTQIIYNASDGKNKFFEVISCTLYLNNNNAILYLLNDLTNYEKVKDLRAKKKYQQIYFASITHDFRTPLSIISGNTDLLIDSEDNPEKRRNLRSIHQASTMLSLLIQDILDFSQMKAGTLKLHNTDFRIDQELNIIVDLFREKFESKNLFLILKIGENVPQNVVSDANRIKQVLMNLVSNAFKFTLKGGVEIIVTRKFNDHKIIQINVKDTGVGIAQEDINKLFKNFGKLASHNNLNPNGIGLGLKICKQIVQKLGGSIEVESTINIGTTFTFSFRNLDDSLMNLSKIIEEKEEIEENKSHINRIEVASPLDLDQNEIIYIKKNESKIKENVSLKEIKVTEEIKGYQTINCRCSKLLIVDDDYSLRNVLGNFSSKCHIEFDQAESGLKALELVKEKCKSSCCKAYKLILMDLNMPIMNGLEASLSIHDYLSLISMDSLTSIILLSGIDEESEKAINDMPQKVFTKIEPKPLNFTKFKNICKLYC